MSDWNKRFALSVAIFLLRIYPAFCGLYAILMTEYITYAKPFQKLFVDRLATSVWGVLALTPFILLKFQWLFRFYCFLFSAVLIFKAYDFLIPFKYVSPSYRGNVPDPFPGYSSRGNDDSIDFWISSPAFVYPTLMMAAVFVLPFFLALIFRRYLHNVPPKSEQGCPHRARIASGDR
jgi:hypothetical protein